MESKKKLKSNITENVLTDQSAGSVQDDGNLKIEQSEAGGKEVNSHLETNEVDETCNSLLLIRFDGGWSKRCYNRNTSSLTRRVDYDLHENEYEDNEQNDIGIDAGGMNYPLEKEPRKELQVTAELNNIMAKYGGGMKINHPLAEVYNDRVVASIFNYTNGKAGSAFAKIKFENAPQ